MDPFDDPASDDPFDRRRFGDDLDDLGEPGLDDLRHADDWDDLGAPGFDDLATDEAAFVRTCGRCGARTSPRWSESASLEEARRYGWRRVADSDRPGARRLDLCGRCAHEAGYGPPLARWG